MKTVGERMVNEVGVLELSRDEFKSKTDDGLF